MTISRPPREMSQRWGGRDGRIRVMGNSALCGGELPSVSLIHREKVLNSHFYLGVVQCITSLDVPHLTAKAAPVSMKVCLSNLLTPASISEATKG